MAILATEAITNAIKHGLGEGAGTITVTLRGAGRTHLLEVRDSGAGPPEDGRTGLGTRILTALSRQIDGEWTIARSAEGGTLFTLSWPESSP